MMNQVYGLQKLYDYPLLHRSSTRLRCSSRAAASGTPDRHLSHQIDGALYEFFCVSSAFAEVLLKWRPSMGDGQHIMNSRFMAIHNR
tara:strand:- start:103253 stop:103513 length:261 start_codon:yes stop_codon:yes gene_type:complete